MTNNMPVLGGHEDLLHLYEHSCSVSFIPTSAWSSS